MRRLVKMPIGWLPSRGMSIVHASLLDIADRPVGSVITVRGKELASGATVAQARQLFGSSSVRLIPLLDGDAYVGAVSREDIERAADGDPVERYAVSKPPTARASAPAGEALLALDGGGGRRLVVLGDDGASYVGLVCVSGDGMRLCIDAECHAG
jgi:CBS domain-containing protein